MIVIRARNVNGAFNEGLALLAGHGRQRKTRGGLVTEMDEPVTTVYERPQEMMLYHTGRHANPFFHVVEGLWMIAGGSSLDAIREFNGNVERFSDDGGATWRGAYGQRWRAHFGFDQLQELVRAMREGDDANRRLVLSMWSPECDLLEPGASSRDVPCNTHVYFRLDPGPGSPVHATVCCRSNDAIWGAYGSNAVHFSMLLQYVAAAARRAVGTLTVVHNNLHVYEETHADWRSWVGEARDLYAMEMVTALPLLWPREVIRDSWHATLDEWLVDSPVRFFCNAYVERVADPMRRAWRARRAGDAGDVLLRQLAAINAPDIREACVRWMTEADRRRTAGRKEE